MMNQKFLVTGAGGFVGSAIVRALVSRGGRVRGLLMPGENPAALQGVDYEAVTGDLTLSADLSRAAEGIDAVFHTASLYCATPFYRKTNPRMHAVNVEGTRSLLEVSLQAGVRRFIYTGSTGAVGLKPDLSPADETVPLNQLHKRSEYEKTKALAEEIVLSYHGRGMDVISIVPSFLIGPGDSRPSPTGEVIVKFLNGRYPCYFDGLFCPSELASTVEAHVKALQAGQSGERYIVTVDERVTIRQLFKMLHEITGIKPPFLKLPRGILTVFAMANELLLAALGLEGRFRPLISFELLQYFSLGASYDSGKAKAALGFAPGTLKEALKAEVEWFMDHGYIKAGALRKFARHKTASFPSAS